MFKLFNASVFVITHYFDRSSCFFVYIFISYKFSTRFDRCAMPHCWNQSLKSLSFAATCRSEAISSSQSESIFLGQTIKSMPCTYALSVKKTAGLDISKCLYFDPNSNGSIPWNKLHVNGKFEPEPDGESYRIHGEMGVGIAGQLTVQPHEKQKIEMSLVWDMPVVSFPGKRRKYHRFYTKFFGNGKDTMKIVDAAFERYRSWERIVYSYQKRVLDDK